MAALIPLRQFFRQHKPQIAIPTRVIAINAIDPSFRCLEGIITKGQSLSRSTPIAKNKLWVCWLARSLMCQFRKNIEFSLFKLGIPS